MKMTNREMVAAAAALGFSEEIDGYNVDGRACLRAWRANGAEGILVRADGWYQRLDGDDEHWHRLVRR